VETQTDFEKNLEEWKEDGMRLKTHKVKVFTAYLHHKK
jgi:hypothetical protein